jgi:hypothetical protein
VRERIRSGMVPNSGFGRRYKNKIVVVVVRNEVNETWTSGCSRRRRDKTGRGVAY